MKLLLSVVVMLAMLARGPVDLASNDVNEHYTACTHVSCEEAIDAVFDALDEVGVYWNSTTVGGAEFDNADNTALGIKEIGIGSVTAEENSATFVYYIVEYDPDSCVLQGLDVGGEFKLYRDATDDYPAGEMEFKVSAVNGNCAMCVLCAEGPLNNDAYDSADVVKALFETFESL